MMVDYIIANSMALGVIDKIMIDDFPPCTNSRNYHSHLMIMIQFGRSSQVGCLMDGKTCYRWVSGMENIWIEHTSMPDFVDGLLELVDEDYSTTDQLHDVVE